MAGSHLQHSPARRPHFRHAVALGFSRIVWEAIYPQSGMWSIQLNLGSRWFYPANIGYRMRDALRDVIVGLSDPVSRY